MQLSSPLPPTSSWTQPVRSSLSWSAFQSKEQLLLRAKKDTDWRRGKKILSENSGQMEQRGMEQTSLFLPRA